MATSKIWTYIVDDFVELMTHDVYSITLNEFKQFTAGIDFTKKSALPSSIWNGAYTINYSGMESSQEINGYFYPRYRVLLQIGFLLNDRDARKSYDNAILDLENIVRVRLQTSTWDSHIQTINHVNTSDFSFYNVENESFAIVTIEFSVVGQTTLL